MFDYRHSQFMDFTAKDMGKQVQKIADRFGDDQGEFYKALKTYVDKKPKPRGTRVNQVGHKWVCEESWSAPEMTRLRCRIEEAIQWTTNEGRKAMQDDMDASLQLARRIAERGIDSSDEEEAVD